MVGEGPDFFWPRNPASLQPHTPPQGSEPWVVTHVRGDELSARHPPDHEFSPISGFLQVIQGTVDISLVKKRCQTGL